MRNRYLDNIRWITVLLVAVFHVFFIFNNVIKGFGVPFAEVQYQDAVMYLLYPWFMIILFIVAGVSSRYFLKKHTVKEFISSRTKKLLVPSTIGVLLFGWIQGYFSMAITGSLDDLSEVPKPVLFMIMDLSGQSILWFAQMLWLFSMLLAFIRRFEKGKLFALTSKVNTPIMILLVVPLWLSGFVLNTPVITVYRFGIYTFSFFLGYFVFAHEEVIERLSKWRFVFIPVAAVLGGLYIFLHFGDNFADMPTINSIPAVAFAWAAILAIFASAKKWGNVTNKFTEFMRTRSWGLYLFHYLAMSVASYILVKYTSLPALPCYLITAVATIGGGLLLGEVISKIPFLRWCLMGISKKKAKPAPAAAAKKEEDSNVQR